MLSIITICKPLRTVWSRLPMKPVQLLGRDYAERTLTGSHVNECLLPCASPNFDEGCSEKAESSDVQGFASYIQWFNS